MPQNGTADQPSRPTNLLTRANVTQPERTVHCWQLFGEVLAAEFSDPAYWPAHQLSVDTCTVWHPGNPDRRNRQPVALNLIGLCLQLEHRVPARQASTLRAARQRRHRRFGFPNCSRHPPATPSPSPT